MAHCWKDFREHLEEMGRGDTDEHLATYYGWNKTCLLSDGHEGKHEWTYDSDVRLTFPKITKENPHA